jgi:hypothetical protein
VKIVCISIDEKIDEAHEWIKLMGWNKLLHFHCGEDCSAKEILEI